MIIARKKFFPKHASKPVEFWRIFVFSDESYFSINLGTIMIKVRRFSNSNPFHEKIVKKLRSMLLK